MRASIPVWRAQYAHDRRKHRHRCMMCKRILVANDRVLMFRRVGSVGVKAIHETCGSNSFGASEFTWTEMTVLCGIEYALAQGFSAKQIKTAVVSHEIGSAYHFDPERLTLWGLKVPEWPVN